MPGTANFSLVKEFSSPQFTRATVFNQFADQVDTLLREMEQEEETLVQVRNMVSDVAQAAAPPGATINGDSWVVSNWGAGNYVGTYVGVFADGDIAQYNDALAGWVRVLANVGGIPVLNTQVIVKAAGAAGSFAAHGNFLSSYNGLWNFEAPSDGRRALVIGEQTIWENQTMVYDAVTAGWYSLGIQNLPLSAQVHVDKAGNDDTGTGTIERPSLTIADAYGLAAAGDTLVIGPGVYTETLVFNTNVRLKARIPGTVTISGTVAAGAVVTVSGAAIGVRFDGINITNLSAAGAAAIALHINNAGATITGPIDFRNGNIISGAGVSRAFEFAGNAGGGLRVNVVRAMIQGTLNVNILHAADYVWHESVEYLGGAAAWFNVTGAGAGRVILSNFLLADAAAGEILDFGGGAACGVALSMGSGVHAGVLHLSNNGGVGIIVMTGGTQVGQITADQADQIIQRWLGEDELSITCYRIDADAIAATVMHTVAGARRFNPHTARTINRAAATGGALNYRFNGTGNGSVVAAVGAGALAQGIANEVVVQDSIAPGGTLEFDETAGSGAPGDFVDAEVIGRMF